MQARLLIAVSLTSGLWIGMAVAEPPHADSVDGQRRAGQPQSVACWARPSDNGQYVGDTIGGGCPLPYCGNAPLANEGTWGWDYQGWLLPRRVILGWWHGRSQGGTGAYRTDGPKCQAHHHETAAH